MNDIQHSSAFTEAYRFLRQRIRDGRLPSGARIKAEEIAAELGLSRMPVREAIRQLDSEGLVTIKPNRGAAVTQLNADDIVELFEMRSVLEGLAIRRAIGRFDEDAFDELELLLVRLGRSQDDFDQWIARHNEFHDAICSRGGSPRLMAYIQRLRTAVEPYLRITLGTPRASGILEEHRLLVEAIRNGDPDAAEALMREHIRGTAGELVGLMSEGSAAGEPPQATSKPRRRSQSVT